jgi:hypothetical protein
VALPDLLTRAGRYVTSYQVDFAAVVGHENYVQTYTHRRLAYPLPTTITRRALNAELAFGWFPNQQAWFGFRDVYEVDGRRIANRERRTSRLFFEDRSGNQLKRVLDESARFNLGPIRRNFNVPMLPLLFLESSNQARLRFELQEEMEPVDGIWAAVVRYMEIAVPTFIQHNNRNAPAEGRFWIEPDTGRIVRSALRVEHDAVDVRIATWYRPDERLGLLVPARMHEVYDDRRRLDEHVECWATYSRFQRFETETKIHAAPPSS